MVNLQISEEADAVLESAAHRVGRTKHEIAEEIILAQFGESATASSDFTPSALSRLHEGFDAAVRGELVPQEEIEAFFDHWERQLHATTNSL